MKRLALLLIMILNDLAKIFGYHISIVKTPKYRHLLKSARRTHQVVKLNKKPFTIVDSLSFFYSYQEIFIDQIYGFKCNTAIPLIIDCGANIGTSIVFFKTIYPQSHIIAIEADPCIFSVLTNNIKIFGFNDVRLENKALSNSEKDVYFQQEGSDGGRIVSNSSSERVITIKSILLDDLITKPIDFLKIDVEGSETDVLASSTKLHLVDKIFIEYHSFRKTKQSLNTILEILTKNGFRYYIKSQFSQPHPYIKIEENIDMDLQLNIFGIKV